MFERVQHVATTDADGAVERCERGFDTPLVRSLRPKCVVHKVSTITKNVYKFVDATHISMLIAAARSLEGNPEMQSFRAVLRHIFMQELVWEQSAPSPRHLERNRRVLETFLFPATPTNRMRTEVLMSLLNGDYASDQITHHCVGCCRSRAHCVAKLCSFAVAVLAGAKPPKWPRHRWLKSDEAIGWFGLLESVHSLFSRVYLRWQEKQAGGVRIVAADGVHAIGGAGAAIGAIPDVPAQGDRPAEEEEVDAVLSMQGQQQAPAAGGPGGPINELQAAREEQASVRTATIQWIQKHPAPMLSGWLIMLRTDLEPLRQLMDGYLSMSSDTWSLRGHLRQRASGVADGKLLYKLAESWRGAHTKPTLDQISTLMNEGMVVRPKRRN